MSDPKIDEYFRKSAHNVFMKSISDNKDKARAFTRAINLLNELELLVASNTKAKCISLLNKQYNERWRLYMRVDKKGNRTPRVSNEDFHFNSEAWFLTKYLLRTIERV